MCTHSASDILRHSQDMIIISDIIIILTITLLSLIRGDSMSRFRQQSNIDADRAQDEASVSASLAEACDVLPTGQADHVLMCVPESYPFQIDLSVHVSTKSTISLPS